MRKKILICHPDVLREVRFETRLYHNPADLDVDFNRMEVRTNQYMDKYQKTGRYILPDGSHVLPEDVVVHDRFTEYGPEDIWYLMWAGIIQEEEAALFYLMEEPPSFLEELDLYSPKIFTQSAW